MLRRRTGHKPIESDAERIRLQIGSSIAGSTDHGGLLGLADDDHGQYMHNGAARTVTAQHTFAPTSPQAPFLLGANAQGQTVAGLRADQLNKSVSTSSGILGGGALTGNLALTLDWGSPTITTIQPDDAVSAGSSVNPARSDHRHAIAAAAAGTIQPGDTAAEGTATSFARSDHRHAIATATPGSILPDDTAAEGVSTSFARSDHRHAITAGTPGAIQPDAIAAEGASTSFARADHQHAITAAAPGANSVNIAASSEGTGTSFARADHTHQLDQGIAPTWTNDHIFQGLLTARHVMPEFPDTYDLGSSTRLWRKGWLSELDAIVFAQNTITLLGGWFMVSKGEGSLNGDAASGDSDMDFGSSANLAVGDFVLLRAAGKVEYMRIDVDAGGGAWEVTRNLDGSGSNDWPAGTPYVNLGHNGTGRIELNAYDTPRIQILTQGATYNSQTEVSRLGDMNGNWGYTGQTYGIALGEYGADKANLTWDATNGLRLRTYTTTVLQLDNSGNADITGKLRLPGTGSALAIGATPPTASNAGTGLWLDRTGLYSLASDVQQIKVDATTGKLWAGNYVSLDASGLTLTPYSGSGYSAPTAVKFVSGGHRYGTLFVDSLGMSMIAGEAGLSGNTILDIQTFSTLVAGSYNLTRIGAYDISDAGIEFYRDYYGVGTIGLNALTSITLNVGGAAMLNVSTSDVYTTAWTNYGASSTITGWSSRSTTAIRYKKIGKLVCVDFYIEGTSNATTVTFTLPFTSANTTVMFECPIASRDSGTTATAPGRAVLAANSATVTCYKDYASAAWTNSGTKMVRGQFWYETA